MKAADQSKILERIRKLRALAGDRAATPAEAAAAAERIQVLMREYGLDQVDVEAAEMTREQVDLARIKSTDIDRLIIAVGAATGCFGILQEIVDERRRPVSVSAVYFGEAPRPEIARYLHAVCYRAVAAADRQFKQSAEYRRRRTIKTKRLAARHFRQAMIETLRRRLLALSWLKRHQLQQLQDLYARTGSGALVIAKKPKLKLDPRMLEAAFAGATAGRQLELQQPMGDARVPVTAIGSRH